MMFLNNLASLVLAQGAPEGEAPAAGFFSPMTLMLIMLAIVYFLLIRPANKQKKQHQELLNALKKDDEVLTSGGIYGRILSIEDKVVLLEIADKVKIRILRDRIAGKWDSRTTTPQQQ